MQRPYDERQPDRADVDRLAGPTVLEFGATWCGYCEAAEPIVARALADAPDLRHLKVADARGRPLGRSFGVKLWPTLVFLRDGREVARVVRPTSEDEVRAGLRALAG